MADWSKPTITSNYVVFVDEVKARDIDAITLQASAVVSPPVGAVKMARLGAPLIKFQEWNGSAFVDRVLSVDAGGTGVTTIPAYKAALGLGTMADQNANAVNISGGGLANVSIVNAGMSGNSSHTGGNFTITSNNNIALSVSGVAGQWTTSIAAVNTTNQSHGLLISAGTTKSDNGFYVRNAAASIYGLQVRGDMGVLIPKGLVIPVGTNAFVGA